MREILFRGKRVDNGEWETGYYVRANYHWHKHGIHKDWIVTGACSNGGWFALHGRYPVVSDTVGQYTGLTDKNGKQIFEGDILDVSGNPDAVLLGYRNGRAIVRWDEDVSGFEPFAYYDSDCGLYICEKECVVIGNIHDNPELIGGKEDA